MVDASSVFHNILLESMENASGLWRIARMSVAIRVLSVIPVITRATMDSVSLSMGCVPRTTIPRATVLHVLQVTC